MYYSGTFLKLLTRLLLRLNSLWYSAWIYTKYLEMKNYSIFKDIIEKPTKYIIIIICYYNIRTKDYLK